MRYNPKKHRLPPFTSNGVLLVDKPAEWTSFDVVNFVRARFNVPKVGHCGTLDPAATGLLVLVLGKFTALSQKFSGEDKVYDATLLLGQETDSGDTTGTVTARGDISGITEEMVRNKFTAFLGTQMQVPPMVSAVKIDGKKLYELAREGKEARRERKRPANIAMPMASRISITSLLSIKKYHIIIATFLNFSRAFLHNFYEIIP